MCIRYGILDGVYGHEVVIHRRNWVHPDMPDVHTNNIEGMWNLSKRKLKWQCGTSRRLFHTYTDEFLWRRRVEGRTFEGILATIAEQDNLV